MLLPNICQSSCCRVYVCHEHLSFWFDTSVEYRSRIIVEYNSEHLRYGLILQWNTTQDITAEYVMSIKRLGLIPQWNTAQDVIADYISEHLAFWFDIPVEYRSRNYCRIHV